MTGRFISYLDLMCCGFGGAMLMFLIVASAQTNRVSGLPMLLIRAKVVNQQGLTPNQSIEFGIQYRRKGDLQWQRANQTTNHEMIAQDGSQAWFFTSSATARNSSESLFICNQPRPGTWEARVYSATISSEEALALGSQPTYFSPVEVLVEVLGSTALTQTRTTITRSAEFTEPVIFEIQGRN
jgi:hypothetical protein